MAKARGTRARNRMEKWIILINGDMIRWKDIKYIYPNTTIISKKERIYSYFKTITGDVYDFLDFPSEYILGKGQKNIEFDMEDAHTFHKLAVRCIENSEESIFDAYELSEIILWGLFVIEAKKKYEQKEKLKREKKNEVS